MQLGFSMDGDVITRTSSIVDLVALYYHLLGCSLGDGTEKFTSLKFSWLRANFETLSDYVTEMEMTQAVQAYIL
ncbi:hypothetical protein J1N35_034856 [Gossypium stocksii]|uniref:Uncharacterized protein n=1 Tax=Gossypium stocksii TaxID=47602 RepID=A0A9D3UST9_9ROSI|nr:hypothetical protein J1N35_034856 [Gossypium stocksii]